MCNAYKEKRKKKNIIPSSFLTEPFPRHVLAYGMVKVKIEEFLAFHFYNKIRPAPEMAASDMRIAAGRRPDAVCGAYMLAAALLVEDDDDEGAPLTDCTAVPVGAAMVPVPAVPACATRAEQVPLNFLAAWV